MRVQLWLVHSIDNMSIVMDEASMEVPGESLMAYKASLFLDTTTTHLDVDLPQHLELDRGEDFCLQFYVA